MQTTFDPIKHGFRFSNHFDIDPAMFGATNLKTWTMGLCGGMCSAALARYHTGEPIPTLDHVPAQKCPELDLFYELFGRQMITLFPTTWIKILAWQIMPEADTHTTRVLVPGDPFGGAMDAYVTDDDRGIGYLTTHVQWPALKKLLAAGKPTILCLIRQEGAGNPSENHQVLAIGATIAEQNRLHIQIYDPNHPRTTQELYLQFGTADNSIHGRESDGKLFRGFFIN
jgi:hypothetical protein